MGLFDFFRRKAEAPEVRSSGTGYTQQIIAAREALISGAGGMAELTATAQSCVSLWENGLSMSDVSGTNLLSRQIMALAGRMMALRGEAVFLIEGEGLIPALDWDISTRNGIARAYRLSIPDTGGGRSVTALAGEVLHSRIGVDVTHPWAGTAPLRRASLTASLLETLERALLEAGGLPGEARP